MWTIKRFKTAAARDTWIAKHEHRYQIVEIFVNNAYALEVRKLRVIKV